MRKTVWLFIFTVILLALCCTTVSAEEITGNLPANGLYVESSADLDKISLSDSVIVCVKNGNIIGANGKTLFSLKNLRKKIHENVFPICSVLYDKDVNTVTTLFKTDFNNDGAVLSANESVLKKVKSVNSKIGRILDLTQKYTSPITPEQCVAICTAANKSGAKAVLLSSNTVDQQTVRLIREGSINVFLKETSLADRTKACRLISSGAASVFTNNPAAVKEAYSLYDPTAVARTPFLWYHRADTTVAPENTISACTDAIAKHADAVEIDVYLTTDGVPVVLHNSTLNRMTDGTGAIEALSLAEIRELHVWGPDAMYKELYPNERIPTLEEVLKLHFGTDTRVIIEIKSSNADICQAVYNCVKNCKMTDRVQIIGFDENTMSKMRKIAPELNCGILYSAGAFASGTPANRANLVLSYDSFADVGINALSPEFLNGTSLRGIFTAGWTYEAGDLLPEFCNSFLWGCDALTFNPIPDVEKLPYMVYCDQSDIVLSDATDTATYRTVVKFYDGTEKDITEEAVPIFTDENNIIVNSGNISASDIGSAGVMFRYDGTLPDGRTYALYSQPISIKVAVPEPEIPEITEEPEKPEVSEPQPPEDSASEITDVSENESAISSYESAQDTSSGNIKVNTSETTQYEKSINQRETIIIVISIMLYTVICTAVTYSAVKRKRKK